MTTANSQQYLYYKDSMRKEFISRLFFMSMILKWTTLSPLPSDLKHALFSLLLDWLKCVFGKGAPAIKIETRSRGPSNGSCRQVLLEATLCYDHTKVRNSHHLDKIFSKDIFPCFVMGLCAKICIRNLQRMH